MSERERDTRPSTSTSSHHHRRSRSPEERSSNRDSHSHSSRRRSRSRSRSRSPDSKSSSRHSSSKREKKSSSSSHHNREDREDREEKELPIGIKEIDESDYFLKSTELKVWLDEIKGRKLDQLSGEDARKYFKKFVKAWNRGQLEDKFYNGIKSSSISASTSSSFSWSFSKASQRELDDAASIRKSIEGGTIRSGSSNSSNKPIQGPTFPPPSSYSSNSNSAVTNLQLKRELESNEIKKNKLERKANYKQVAKEERDELKSNQSTGRERLLEKRREGNAINREMREGKESGGMMEFDEDTLMGGSSGGGFKEMIEARDRRGPGKKQLAMEEKKAYISDKVSDYRKKEDSTMAMFRDLAAARFG